SNDNQTDGESYDIVSTKKKKLPMYVIGYSTGGNIALRILQLLNKEKEDRIKAWNSNNDKNSNIILDNSTDVNDIDNGMSNYKNGDPGTSSASTSATTNAIASVSDKHKGYYNSLDKFNIKGCITISAMIRIKSKRDPGNKSLKYFYLPIIKLLSFILPYKRFLPLSSYKGSAYVANVSKHDKFRNNNGITFKSMYELIKATITLDYNINYMPKNIPLLFVHSKDDRVCSYEWTALFHNKVKVDKKDLYTLDDMGHAITMKPGNEEVLKKIIDWIYDLRNGEDEIEDEI
ncbi:Serine aminopeptidase, S33, putative, partial [Plasmodium chabaudi adami]